MGSKLQSPRVETLALSSVDKRTFLSIFVTNLRFWRQLCAREAAENCCCFDRPPHPTACGYHPLPLGDEGLVFHGFLGAARLRERRRGGSSLKAASMIP
jgi:hypothetical protein